MPNGDLLVGGEFSSAGGAPAASIARWNGSNWSTFGVGVGLLIQHRSAYREFRRAPDNAGFVAAVTGSAVGSAMVGAGVGLGIAAITAGLTPEMVAAVSKIMRNQDLIAVARTIADGRDTLALGALLLKMRCLFCVSYVKFYVIRSH